MKSFNWFVTHFTPQIRQQRMFSEFSICRAPTEIHFIERSVFQKDVNSNKDLQHE